MEEGWLVECSCVLFLTGCSISVWLDIPCESRWNGTNTNAITGDTKAGTYIGTDRYGNKFYENMEEELPRMLDLSSGISSVQRGGLIIYGLSSPDTMG